MKTISLALLLLATAGLEFAQKAAPIELSLSSGGVDPDRIFDCLDRTTVSFGVSPAAAIDIGNWATLSWSVKPPSGCTFLRQAIVDGVSYPLTGSAAVQPLLTTSYALVLPFSGGSREMARVTVTVNLPGTVYINGSSSEWRRLLIFALAKPGKKVVLAPSVDMDLSGYFGPDGEGIQIAENTTLTSELPFSSALSRRLARDARHLGPRLFTTTRPRKQQFHVVGNNIHIEGFRLQGPDFSAVDCQGCDNPYAIGIYDNSGIEISNMELSGWNGGAIVVNDEGPDDIRRDNPNAVWIHDNFIHHNLHRGQFGYGVDVGHGAYALIEQNVFDFNRHAITGGADAGTGYFAHRNLILKGGTGEGACFSIVCLTTQEFDVHGTQNCIIPPLDQGCGQAGEYIEMTENAFQYAIGYSIKVRGNPIVGALAASNVFANSEGDAISQNGNVGVGDNITNPIQRQGNVFSFDSYGKYGVCDFDGDGFDDLFLATGVTWWYRSAATMHWVYLNASTERLDQVGLGDFDGDHFCDVFSVHANDFGIYPGGRGPWRSLGTYSVPFNQLRFGDFNGDGIMDIFRRAPDSQWWIVSPGHYDWTPIQSSPKALSELRFGDFDGNHITDLISLQDGHWAVSWDGRSVWQPLNSLGTSLQSVFIGDIDGNGKDEILRYRLIDLQHGVWEVSWDGRSDWTTLQQLIFPSTPDPASSAANVFGFVGRFRSAARADLVSVDYTRMGTVFDLGSRQFVPHSLYAY